MTAIDEFVERSILMQEYTKTTLAYFEDKSESFYASGNIDQEIFALDKMVCVLIKLKGIISPNKIDELLDEIKSGSEKIYYKGLLIKIVSSKEFNTNT